MGQARVVAGHQNLGAGLAHVAGLVGTHRDRDIGILQREGAAETAALARPWQLDKRQPLDRAQQAFRSVTDLEHSQRMAGRVIGHPVREVGADVDHAEASTRNSLNSCTRG